jgi:hypothetical protein
MTIDKIRYIIGDTLTDHIQSLTFDQLKKQEEELEEEIEREPVGTARINLLYVELNFIRYRLSN